MGSFVSVGPLQFPRVEHRTSSGTSMTAISTVDQVGDYILMGMQAPETGDIQGVGFATRTVAVTGTARITLEELSANGSASGILIDTDADVVGTLTASTDDNSWFWWDFPGPISVTRGQFFAVVFRFTDTDGATFQIGSINGRGGWTFPYTKFVANGVTLTTANNPNNIILRYAGTDTAFIASSSYAAVDDINLSVWADQTDFDNEYGLRFRLPMGCKVSGWWFGDVVGDDFSVLLYTDGGTELASVSFLAGQVSSAPGFSFSGVFPSDITLEADTWYRLTQRQDSAGGTSNVISGATMADAAAMEAYDGGEDFQLTTRQRNGSWNDDPLRRPVAAVMVSEVLVN
jgi:hypothetical protein